MQCEQETRVGRYHSRRNSSAEKPILNLIYRFSKWDENCSYRLLKYLLGFIKRIYYGGGEAD